MGDACVTEPGMFLPIAHYATLKRRVLERRKDLFII
jgi:hypothetical protein